MHYKRNGLPQHQLANALCRCIANQLHRLHHHRLRGSLVLLAGAKLGTMVSHARVPAVLLEHQVPLPSTSASPSNRTRDDHVRGYSGSLLDLVSEYPNCQDVVPKQPRGRSADDYKSRLKGYVTRLEDGGWPTSDRTTKTGQLLLPRILLCHHLRAKPYRSACNHHAS